MSRKLFTMVDLTATLNTGLASLAQLWVQDT